MFMPPTTPQVSTIPCLWFRVFACFYMLVLDGHHRQVSMPHTSTKSYYKLLQSAEPANCFTVVLDLRCVANHMLSCQFKTPRLLLSFHEFVCLAADSTDLWYPSYTEHRRTRKRLLHGGWPSRQKHRVSKGIFKPKVKGFLQDFSGAIKISNPKK